MSFSIGPPEKDAGLKTEICYLRHHHSQLKHKKHQKIHRLVAGTIKQRFDIFCQQPLPQYSTGAKPRTSELPTLPLLIPSSFEVAQPPSLFLRPQFGQQ
jgi:hypothetical protein